MPTNKLVSPNDIHDAAKTSCLNGYDPVTPHDWQLVVNFWAWNIMGGLETSACKLMAMMYHCPLSVKDVETIAKYQASRK